MEPLVTRKEVAEFLGINPRTLDNWASAGRGPSFVKVGGNRRYDMADVRAWVEARKVRH
jgi:excisionase family DNA binding protein